MLDVCPERSGNLTEEESQSCIKACLTDKDCTRRRKCLCDGACGLSCVSQGRSCPWPLEKENAHVLPIKGSQTFDAVIKVICKPGFQTANKKKEFFSRCQGNRKWSEETTTCEYIIKVPVFCTQPNNIEHRFHNGSEFRAGDLIQYNCSPGFQLEGTDINYCQEDGLWRYPEPTCQAIPKPSVVCMQPNDIEHGFHSGSEFKEGDTVQYSCSPGFQLEGTNINYCQEDGNWKYPEPTCQKVFCKPPKEISNGYLVAVQKPKYQALEIIYYLCKKGFFLDGVNKVICQINGSWSNVPACRDRCKIPVERSRVLYKGKKLWVSEIPDGLVRHGEEVSFYCRSKDETCSYTEFSVCFDGVLPPPSCYKEPTWVQYNLFPNRLVSEITPC
ncbi:beta-2-glycoprotein 1-like isoform X2 [Protopterus annectens]|nr:beta-2-glycoprotein 1-like isoform X2 [Protopterus annectens]